MPDLTTSTPVDNLMQATTVAQLRAAIFASMSAAGAFNDADKILIGQSGAYVETTWGAIKAAILLAKYPEVANFAALPAAADHNTETYVCLAAQGTYFINRKAAGFYYSNGSAWSFVGELPEDYFTDSILQIADDSDPTKIVKFQLSSITTGTIRTLTVPDASGTIALTSDAAMTNERVPTAAGLTSKFGTNKASIADGDKFGLLDSAASDAPKHGLWSLVKSTLKTYFDTLYQAAGSYLTSGGALGTPSSGTLTNCTGLPVAGAVMATARILGRTTASTGAVEEITVGTGLSLSAGSLVATGGGGADIFDFTKLDAVATFGGSTLACNVPYRGTAIGTGTLTTYSGADFPAAEIRTGTTSGWGYYVAFWASSGTSNTFDLDETHTWTMMFWIRTGADIGNYRLLVGAVGTAGAAVPVAGIGVRFDTDASDTNFRLAAWDASTPTLGSDNLGAVATNTVYAIKIWCTGDGTVRATVNGGTQSTLTTGFTATRVTPLFQLINSTTADKRMQVARFAFHIEGLSP